MSDPNRRYRLERALALTGDDVRDLERTLADAREERDHLIRDAIRAGLSTRQVAELARVSHMTVARIARGDR